MLYRNIKTGNLLSPASKEAGEIMAKSSLYEPVRPVKQEEPAQACSEEPPEEPQKAAKNKKG